MMKYTLPFRYLIESRLFSVIIFLFLFSGSIQAQYLTLLEQRLKYVIREKQATVGVASKLLGQQAICINHAYYPTMSVYKFHLALAVLDKLDRETLPLETEIRIQQKDLLPDTYSPLRDKYSEGKVTLTIGDLLYYSVSLSDNNACDILFRYVGGTVVVDQYIRSLGIEDFYITATEAKMHESIKDEYRNQTTPEAAVELMEIFLTRELFASVYKDFLYKLLTQTRTGKDKLKAGLPEGTVLGHKTGNSSRDENNMKIADNDLGFVQLPDNRYYAVGVFIKDSYEDDKSNAELTSRISEIVYNIYNNGLEDVYSFAQQLPEFPGGMKEAVNYLENATIPLSAKATWGNGIPGRLIVGFVVEKDGSISNPEILRSVDPYLDKEAIKAVTSLPRWTPGYIQGEPVRCYYALPVRFRSLGFPDWKPE